MKDQSFERAMNQIAREADAEQQRELKAAHRRKIWGRVRNAALFVFTGGALAAGLYYHQELQDFAESKFKRAAKNEQPGGAAVKDLQAKAAARDKAIDDISK